MSTDNDEAVPDSEACSSDDARNSPNATDDEATPSQYKKTRRDDDDDEEKANESDDDPDKAIESEGLSEEYIDPATIDCDAALKIDCKEFVRRIEHMGAQLHAIIKVQKEHKASKRERGAELPAPDPKRPAPFTPSRKALKPLSNVVLKAKNPIWMNLQMKMIQFIRSCLPRLRARNCNRTGDFSVLRISLNAVLSRYRHG
jgi:hypothetical protein